VKRAFVLVMLLAAAPRAAAQEPPGDALVPQITQARPSLPLSADAYVPITGLERVRWIVDGIVGPRSLGVGVLGGIWQTGFNTPQEWGRTPSGFGKRYLEREADVAISNTIEAGLGALWGEEPRYIPSGRRGLRPRVQYALKTAFLAQRRDGRLAPAWGRYAGNVFNNLIENSWLPPSATTPGETAIRSVEGMVTRMLGNLWEEFWPEVRKRIGK
jgi:hypothetical protein